MGIFSNMPRIIPICYFGSRYRASFICHTIAPYIGFGRLFGAPRVQIPPRGFRPIANRTSFSASPSWVSAGCGQHLHISAMSKRKNAADAMRARAREVRQDASYGGIFEMCVWCRMRKVGLLLAYGVTIINVLPIFGKDVKRV